MMKIASWNVNSIKVRGETVVDWLKSSETDILFMQEIKSTDDNFPTALFTEAGYTTHTHGQKTYNGVAVAVKNGLKVDAVRPGLPGDKTDEQARYIEIDCVVSCAQDAKRPHRARQNIITMGGIYLPNGNPVDDESPKFPYKLGWMRRLIDHARALNETGRPVLLCGDFNIIPADMDCPDPARWRGDALFHPESLVLWRELNWLGYTDLFRARHPSTVAYTFWDYQGGAWQKDDGIRIDHFLTNAEATDMATDIGIDKEPRGREKPSDHTPIWCNLVLK